MSRGGRAVLLGFGLLLVLLVLTAVGCGPNKAQIVAQQTEECAANQHRIKLAIDLVHADTGVYPDIATVVDKLHVVCPSKGTYSFDPATDTVSCSFHGKL